LSKNDNSKKPRNKLRETLADTLDLPKEIIMDIPKLTLIGNNEITIESHKGVIQYSSERIRISITGGELIIDGRGLIINSILPEEITIYGEISQVSFED